MKLDGYIRSVVVYLKITELIGIYRVADYELVSTAVECSMFFYISEGYLNKVTNQFRVLDRDRNY